MNKILMCAASLALALPLAASANANGVRDGAVVVPYNDLNLDQQTGAAVMLQRLDSAAMEACGAADGSLRELRWSVRDSRCHAERLSQAVADLNAPSVTALYNERLVVLDDGRSLGGGALGR